MLRPDYLVVALLEQAAYLFPWIWIPLVVILVRECRQWPQKTTDHQRLWLCLSILPLGVFTLVACFRSVLPHWGLVGLALCSRSPGTQLVGETRKTPVANPQDPRGLCDLLMRFPRFHDRRVSLRRASARSCRPLGTDRRAARSHTRSLRLGSSRAPDQSTQIDRPAGYVRFHALLVSRRLGLRMPWAASIRSCVITPMTRADLLSGAGLRIGLAATGSWLSLASPSRWPAILGRLVFARRAGLGFLGRTVWQAGPAHRSLSVRPAAVRLSLRFRSSLQARSRPGSRRGRLKHVWRGESEVSG